MVINQRQTTVAYRCPYCGAGIMSLVGLFSLRADKIILKCDCGRSLCDITCTADGKIRLSVPCVICPRPHNFTVGASLFFGRPLFLLPCPYSDIDIFFIGHEREVSTALAKTELELLDMLEQSSSDSFESLHRDSQKLTDPQVFDVVMFIIKDLEEEGQISCSCDGAGDYTFEIEEECIRVFCVKCGAQKRLPINSFVSADSFLNCSSLKLE